MSLGRTISMAMSLALGTSAAHRYQRMRPVTSKNIGRNWLKGKSRYMPHQGRQECERRLRQRAAVEVRRGGAA